MNLRRSAVYALCALVLSGCSFVVTVDTVPHLVSVHPLVETPVYTPPATGTATPQVTPSATFPTVEYATPTAEVGTGTPLPTPVGTPEPPDEALCFAGVAASTLNVRAEHSISATVVRKLTQSQRVEVSAVYVRYPEGSAVREEWGRIDGGWIAVWYNGAQLAVLDDSAPCWELPLTYASAKPASTFGLHLIFSAGGGALNVPELGVLKATDGAEWVIRAAKLQRPSVLTIWRNLNNCPPSWGQGEPFAVADAWWQSQYAVWRNRGLLGYVDVFESINECGNPPAAWESAFWLRTLDHATNAGVCLAVYSDAYGTPDLAAWNGRRPVLDAMLQQECMSGRRHVLALHSYEGAQSGVWLFGRWRLIMALLGDAYRAIPIIFTEYGYGTGDAPADCARFWADWQLARVAFAADPQIWGVAHFSVGGGTQWTDLTGCLQ